MAQKHVAVYNISCCPYTLKKEGITMICPKRYKTKNVAVTMCTCQQCAYPWKA